jgi:hypothetical protein
MADLSHWDFAAEFTGYEAAALILGVEPGERHDDEYRVRVVQERLEHDYERAIAQATTESSGFEWPEIIQPRVGLLVSVKLDELWRDAADGMDAPLTNWLMDRRRPQFENQEFSRKELATWLHSAGMKSVYPFESMPRPGPVDSDQVDIDPADFPEELQAANIAFRAVSNGFGDQSATFKNRLIEYLEKNYPTLNSEAVARIATVANPDKVRGRKKMQG